MARLGPYLARSPGLGEKASIAELIEGGLVPGRQGITLTDRTVRFGDLYKLTERTNIDVINDQFVRALENNPRASVPHERVIYGSGDTESTLYHPSVFR